MTSTVQILDVPTYMKQRVIQCNLAYSGNYVNLNRIQTRFNPFIHQLRYCTRSCLRRRLLILDIVPFDATIMLQINFRVISRLASLRITMLKHLTMQFEIIDCIMLPLCELVYICKGRHVPTVFTCILNGWYNVV